MYTLPDFNKISKTSQLNDEVTIATLAKHSIQIGSSKNPALVYRVIPPYGKTWADTVETNDCSRVLDICDARQEEFFTALENEIEKACRETFNCDLPMKRA